MAEEGSVLFWDAPFSTVQDSGLGHGVTRSRSETIALVAWRVMAGPWKGQQERVKGKTGGRWHRLRRLDTPLRAHPGELRCRQQCSSGSRVCSGPSPPPRCGAQASRAWVCGDRGTGVGGHRPDPAVLPAAWGAERLCGGRSRRSPEGRGPPCLAGRAEVPVGGAHRTYPHPATGSKHGGVGSVPWVVFLVLLFGIQAIPQAHSCILCHAVCGVRIRWPLVCFC